MTASSKTSKKTTAKKAAQPGFDPETERQRVLNAPYYGVTKQGYVIADRFLDNTGGMVIVGKRPDVNDWFTATFYSVFSGTWSGQGRYMYRDEAAAIRGIMEDDLIGFDPDDLRDVDFYLDNVFNYNHVGATYLEDNGHRDEGFDTRKAFDGTDEEYDAKRKELRVRNTKPKTAARKTSSKAVKPKAQAPKSTAKKTAGRR